MIGDEVKLIYYFLLCSDKKVRDVKGDYKQIYIDEIPYDPYDKRYYDIIEFLEGLGYKPIRQIRPSFRRHKR